MDYDWIWIDDQRWRAADGSQLMAHGGWMAINPLLCVEDIVARQSYTIFMITTLI